MSYKYPLSNQRRREKYPDGTCPACGAQAGWIRFQTYDEGDLEDTGSECLNCEAQFQDEQTDDVFALES